MIVVTSVESVWMTRLEGSSNFYPSFFVYSRPFSRAFLDKSQSLPLCRLALPPYFSAWTRSESPPLLSYTPLFPYTLPHTSIALVHIHVLIPHTLPNPPTILRSTLIEHGGQKTIRDPKHPTTHPQSYTYISIFNPTTLLPHTSPSIPSPPPMRYQR
jgi:hypothetical protein